MDAEIIGVVSNHANGGVAHHARECNVPFISFPEKSYGEIITETQTDFIALSGWLKLVSGLDPQITFNIHPGPLPNFGGSGLYGHHVHEAVLRAYKRGEITHSAVSMHFVTEKYDEGPIFFNYPVAILPDDTPETLGKRVNDAEHKWQPIITNKVVQGKIHWDGKNPDSLIVGD